ncbi:Hypothetical predicted protein, partial [Lecanosticta acicola]
SRYSLALDLKEILEFKAYYRHKRVLATLVLSTELPKLLSSYYILIRRVFYEVFLKSYVARGQAVTLYPVKYFVSDGLPEEVVTLNIKQSKGFSNYLRLYKGNVTNSVGIATLSTKKASAMLKTLIVQDYRKIFTVIDTATNKLVLDRTSIQSNSSSPVSQNILPTGAVRRYGLEYSNLRFPPTMSIALRYGIVYNLEHSVVRSLPTFASRYGARSLCFEYVYRVRLT